MFIDLQPFYSKFFDVLTNLKENLDYPSKSSELCWDLRKSNNSTYQWCKLSKQIIFYFWVIHWA